MLLLVFAVQLHQSVKSMLDTILLQPIKQKSYVQAVANNKAKQCKIYIYIKKTLIITKKTTLLSLTGPPPSNTSWCSCSLSLQHADAAPWISSRLFAAVPQAFLCLLSAAAPQAGSQPIHTASAAGGGSQCTAGLYRTARLCWQIELTQIKMVKWYLAWLLTLATTLFFFLFPWYKS